MSAMPQPTVLDSLRQFDWDRFARAVNAGKPPVQRITQFVVAYVLGSSDEDAQIHYYRCRKVGDTVTIEPLPRLGGTDKHQRHGFALVFDGEEDGVKIKGADDTPDGRQRLLLEARACQQVADGQGAGSVYALPADKSGRYARAGYLTLTDAELADMTNLSVAKVEKRIVLRYLPKPPGVIGSAYVQQLAEAAAANLAGQQLGLLEQVLLMHRQLYDAGIIVSDAAGGNFTVDVGDDGRIARCYPIDFGSRWQDGERLGEDEFTHRAVGRVDRATSLSEDMFATKRLLLAIKDWYDKHVLDWSRVRFGEIRSPLVYDENFFDLAGTNPAQMLDCVLSMVRQARGQQQNPGDRTALHQGFLHAHLDRLRQLQAEINGINQRLATKPASTKARRVAELAGEFQRLVTNYDTFVQAASGVRGHAAVNVFSYLEIADLKLVALCDELEKHRQGVRTRAGAEKIMQAIDKHMILRVVLIVLVVVGWVFWGVSKAIANHRPTSEQEANSLRQRWKVGNGSRHLPVGKDSAQEPADRRERLQSVFALTREFFPPEPGAADARPVEPAA